jgi:hypothetical protein
MDLSDLVDLKESEIKIQPSKHKTIRVQYIFILYDQELSTLKQIKDQVNDFAKLLIKAVSPHFTQAFLEEFRK